MEDLRLHQEEEEKSEHIEMSRRTWSNVSSLTDQSATERQFFNTFTDGKKNIEFFFIEVFQIRFLDVVVKIVELKKKYPWMYPWQIRKRLYQDLDFITKPLPSVKYPEKNKQTKDAIFVLLSSIRSPVSNGFYEFYRIVNKICQMCLLRIPRH